MTDYQLSVFFGTPVVVALLAWGLVGLHRLMPRPALRSPVIPRDSHAAGRIGGLARDVDHSVRAPVFRKHRKQI
jgi:hypothetical protein